MEHYAIPLGEFDQGVDLLLAGIGIEVETKTDVRKANRRLFLYAEGATCIDIAFGMNRCHSASGEMFDQAQAQ